MTVWLGGRTPQAAQEAGLGHERYADPDLVVPPHPGEVSGAPVRYLHKVLEAVPRNPEDLTVWFGRYITASRGPAWTPCYPPEVRGGLVTVVWTLLQIHLP